MPDTTGLLGTLDFQDAVDMIGDVVTNPFILAAIVFSLAILYVPKIVRLVKRSAK